MFCYIKVCSTQFQHKSASSVSECALRDNKLQSNLLVKKTSQSASLLLLLATVSMMIHDMADSSQISFTIHTPVQCLSK